MSMQILQRQWLRLFSTMLLLLATTALASQTALANSSLTGTVSDATTGQPISGVTISVGGQTTVTDASGSYSVSGLSEGGLSAGFYANNTQGEAPLTVDFFDASTNASENLTAEANGYASFSFDHVRLAPGENRYDFAMSPEIFDQSIRVVLTWGEYPRDLDSHLLTPQIEDQAHHVAYYSRGSAISAPYAELDVDDTSSYGPETITIAQRFSGIYHYYVHNYSGGGTPMDTGLSTSQAVVKIYDATGNVNTLSVPQGTGGRYWYVGTIDGSTGIFTAVNRIQDVEPGSSMAGNVALSSMPEKPASAEVVSSQQTINRWQWSFGDGNVSSERNPRHTYVQPGVYDVSLTVWNDLGETNSVLKRQFINAITTQQVTSLEGYVTDATNGYPLAYVPVTLSGSTVYTDSSGYYRFDAIPNGLLMADFYANNTVGPAPLRVEFFDASSSGSQTVSAEYSGYSPYRYTHILIESDTVNRHDISMTPELNVGTMRFVLTWGAEPRDLDSHLLTPVIEGSADHIAYYNRGTDTSWPYANLDVDDVSGFGPETVTINQMFPGTYSYYVHLFSGTGTLAGSGAVIEIYDSMGLRHSFRAPATGEGLYWYVGDLDGSTGQFRAVNRIEAYEPGSLAESAQGAVSYPPKSASMNTSSTIVSWFWNFGDNTSATEQNPIHTYSQPGVYDVSLEVMDRLGNITALNMEEFITAEGSNSVQYGLSVAVQGPGAVTSTPSGILCGARCQANFEIGSAITLIAQPNLGATFQGWTGACMGTNRTCTVTMDRVQSVGARFLDASTSHAVAVNVVGQGSVVSSPEGLDCNGFCVRIFPGGTALTLTATPVQGWSFAGWEGACSGTQSSCTISVSQAAGVTAIFREQVAASQHLLNVIVVGAGQVGSTPTGIACGNGGSDCSQAYTSGTSVTLTATPAAGNTFVGWGGSCVGAGAETTCTLLAVTTNEEQLPVVAAFATAPPERETTDWQVAEIYMATLGRAPDSEGFDYWSGMMTGLAQWTAGTVAQAFFNDQPLVDEIYPPTMTNREFVDELYRNIYDRGADSGGLAYWLPQLDNGQLSRDQMVIALINGGWGNDSPEAQADMQRFAYRVNVSLAFTQWQRDNRIVFGQLSAENREYFLTVARQVLRGVNYEESSRDAAIASIPTLLGPLVQ